MKNERQTWIDYARGIAIILVLYRHVFEGLKNSGLQVQEYIGLEHANILLFSFRMPLFFIISGLFITSSLQKRGLPAFTGSKARTILYPYFVWGILQISLQILMSGFVNTKRGPEDYLLLLYLPRGVEQFWYLYALFNVSVLYALSKTVFRLNVYQNIGIGLTLFYISCLLARDQVNIGFLSDIMHYYVFYAIGDLCGRFIRDKKNLESLQSWKTWIFLLLPFIGSQVYFLHKNLAHSPATYDYVENYEPFYFLIIALTGCAFIISTSFIFQKLKIAVWLHQLGKYSLYIYVAHVMALAATRIMMVKGLGITSIPVLLISGIVMGLLLPVVLYKLAVRFHFHWLFSMEKPVNNLKIETVKAQKIFK